MRADYRVKELVTEEGGDVVAICYDVLYGETFEKYIGIPDDFDARENASNLLQDSNYEISDDIRAELEETFGLAEFDDDQDYDGYQFYDFGDEEEDEEDFVVPTKYLKRESFNLREALNTIDLNTYNKYDLLNLYEACNLSENEKRALANIVYDQNDPSVIYDTLNNRFLGKEIEMPERVKDGVIHEDLEDVEFVMSNYMPDLLISDIAPGKYEASYRGNDSVSVVVEFDTSYGEFVYTIDGEGPYSHSSYEYIQGDIERALDSKLRKNESKSIKEEYEVYLDTGMDDTDEFFKDIRQAKKFAKQLLKGYASENDNPVAIIKKSNGDSLPDNWPIIDEIGYNLTDGTFTESLDEEYESKSIKESVQSPLQTCIDAWKKLEQHSISYDEAIDLVTTAEQLVGYYIDRYEEEAYSTYLGNRGILSNVTPAMDKKIIDLFNQITEIKWTGEYLEESIDDYTVGDDLDFIGNAQIIKASQLPKIGEKFKGGITTSVDKAGFEDGYVLYRVGVTEEDSLDIYDDFEVNTAHWLFAIKGFKESSDEFEFDDEFNAYYDGYTEEDKDENSAFNKLKKNVNEEFYDFRGLNSELRKVLNSDEIDNHNSDLYVKKTPESTEILKKFNILGHSLCTTFIDQITHTPWYEIAFGYVPNEDDMGTYFDDIQPELEESVDEETPYTKEEIERDLKSITHNFTDKEGELKCGFEEEKNYGVEILKQHYKVVETSGDDRREGTWYHISYAEPIK